MKITYAAATSLDGFIAKEDGDVSWLDDLDIDSGETGLEAFFASIDGLVMGRNTYDFVFEFGSWPYEDKPTWICTSREVVALEGANISAVDDIQAVINGAMEQGLTHLWLVGGGSLASAFLNRGLLTHISISEMPVTLGTGIPLFAEHHLKQISSASFEVVEKNGFKQINMTVAP